MRKVINLHGKPRIGAGCEPYLLAEIGTNHNGDIQVARDLVKVVAESGFDCAKFQIYDADEIVSSQVQASDYGLDGYYGDITAREMFDKHLKTPKEWFPELTALCRKLGIDCAVTIHGERGLAWAKKMDFDIIKVASMDHNNLPFLRSLVNAIDAPILISFGMATLEGIDSALNVLQSHRFGVGIFHCVSIYPPLVEELRLSNISFLSKRFSAPVGLSDHSADVMTSLAALSLGARLFEKHITLNKKSMGPDHPFALEPDEMNAYVQGLRTLARGLDSGNFQMPTEREFDKRSVYLKSVTIARNLPAGHKLESSDLLLTRPGSGIPPNDLSAVIGRVLARTLQSGAALAWEDLLP